MWNCSEAFSCTDEILTPVYDLAAAFQIPVLFHSGWDNPQYSAPDKMKILSQNRPQNQFVYCHCFYPNLAVCFDTLKGCQNVFFDLSSVADEPRLLPKFKQELETAIAEMPHRFIFGSDFGSCSQKAHLDFAADLDITPQQRDLLMYGNARAIYAIDNP